MSQTFQHILVLILVVFCVGVVAWQFVRGMSGKRSKLGSCCSKGCSTDPAPKANRVVFMPVEMLTGRKS